MASARNKAPEGAERSGVWGGGVPCPTGEESGDGVMPPLQNILIRFFSSKWQVLVHSGS